MSSVEVSLQAGKSGSESVLSSILLFLGVDVQAGKSGSESLLSSILLFLGVDDSKGRPKSGSESIKERF